MPLPQGYTLDGQGGGLPPGYTLDKPETGAEFVARNRRTDGLPGEMVGLQAAEQNPIMGTLVGAGKNAINLGYNVGRLAGLDRNPDLEYALQPENTAQAAGDFIATVAPYAAVTKPLQAAQGAIAGSRMVTALPKLAQVAVNTAARAGIQGAATGAISAAQGGDFGDSAAMGAIGGAAEPVIAGALNAVANKLGANLVGATKNTVKTGANPGAAVVESGPVTGTLNTLYEKLSKAREAAGQQLSKVLSRSPKQLDVTNSILDPAIHHERILSARGDSTAVVQEVIDGITKDFHDMGASPASATPSQIHSVIDNLDKGVTYTKDQIGGTKNAIIKDVRRALSQQIKTNVPEAKEALQNYANHASATGALRDKMAAESVGPTLTKTAGNLATKVAVSALAHGAGVSNPAIAGTYIAGKAVSSTPGQLALIRLLSKTSTPTGQALVRGMIARAMRPDADEDDEAMRQVVMDAAEAGNGDPHATRQNLFSKQAVYIQPDGTEVLVPEPVTRAFYNGIR